MKQSDLSNIYFFKIAGLLIQVNIKDEVEMAVKMVRMFNFSTNSLS